MMVASLAVRALLFLAQARVSLTAAMLLQSAQGGRRVASPLVADRLLRLTPRHTCLAAPDALP